MKQLDRRTAAVAIPLIICGIGCAQIPTGPGGTKGVADAGHSPPNMARLFEQRGQWDKARKLYLASLKRDPKQPLAYHRLAVLAFRQDQPEQAESYFKQAYALSPHNADLLCDMGYFYYRQGHFDEAENVLRLALSNDPQHARAINNLGLVLGQQGRFEESLEMFRRVLSEDQVYSNLAFVHAQRGEYEQAQQLYSQALTLNNDLKPAAEALLQLAEHKSRKPAPKPLDTKEPQPQPLPEEEESSGRAMINLADSATGPTANGTPSPVQPAAHFEESGRALLTDWLPISPHSNE